jgi:ferrous iron transport protein A
LQKTSARKYSWRQALNKHYTLSFIPVGTRVRLKKIDAGRQVTHRLTELGLTPGVELTIIQDSGGPLLISVRGSRIAIGRGMANKILVTPIDEQMLLNINPSIYEVIKS